MAGVLDTIKIGFKFYDRKGVSGLILSAVVCLSYFYLAHYFVQKYWSDYLNLGSWRLVYPLTQVLVPASVLILSNVPMYFIYKFKIPFFEKYRVQKKIWPWEEDYINWIQKELPKLLGTVFLNEIVIGLLLAIPDSFLFADTYRKDVQSFPQLQEILLQVVFCMIVEDFTFYWGHRTFHSDSLYKYHKVHHENYNTFSICAFYSHPVDFILTSVLPAILGWKLLGQRMHYATYLIWITWRTLETMDGHCGYEFPWSPFRIIPFSGSSEFHNFHHQYNVGNFSSMFTYLDTIFKTNSLYYQVRPQVLGTIKKPKN